MLQRMEDNPGEVTAEAEEHYEELAKDVRSLHWHLILILCTINHILLYS